MQSARLPPFPRRGWCSTVLLDREHRITHAFAGEMFDTHRAACATAREIAMQPVAQR
jgi:nickel-dependent lactate racemase